MTRSKYTVIARSDIIYVSRGTETHKLYVLGAERDTLYYCDETGRERAATLQHMPWCKKLHGNAPPGTRYAYYKLQLPSGARVNYNLYT